MKEKLLILEDLPFNADKLIKGLSGSYQCYHFSSMQQFTEACHNKEIADYDIGVFDIRLVDKEEENMQGIDAAVLFNEIKPRPTLFITAFDYADTYYEATQDRVPHSAYCPKSGENWVHNVLRQLGTAKKLFGLAPTVAPVITDQLTFRLNNSNDRIFLSKDEIFYVKKEDKLSVFVTTKGEFKLFASLDLIENQLKPYQKYGWNFKRVSGNCLLNIEKIHKCEGQYILLDLKDKDGKNVYIKAGENQRDYHFEEWFISLTTR